MNNFREFYRRQVDKNPHAAGKKREREDNPARDIAGVTGPCIPNKPDFEVPPHTHRFWVNSAGFGTTSISGVDGHNHLIDNWKITYPDHTHEIPKPENIPNHAD